MKNIKFSLLLLPLILLGCTNESTSDLIDDGPIDVEITYDADIKTIIETNCLFCHSLPPQNGAPMSLTSYTDVKNAVLTRGLIDRISRSQGSPGMMPNGGTRLPQQLIDKIVAWEQGGFVE